MNAEAQVIPTSDMPTAAAVRDAATAIKGQVVRTPLVPAPALSRRFGCQLSLKLETQQVTGSFKERGAALRLAALDESQRARGVVACSAGNHAQGVAAHAARLGVRAVIVMPRGTPFAKIARTEAHGAEVKLAGPSLAAAEDEAHRLAAAEGLTFIHPYDDPLVIAGQGTCGLEMLEDDPALDMLIVPVGGGGLIAGIGLIAKAINPAIAVIGVQTRAFPAMKRALAGAGPQAPEAGGGATTLAEGIAVGRPGRLTTALARQVVDDILLVDETSLEAAVCLLVETQKLVAEGAGAAGIAALLTAPERFAGRRVGVVICGGNIDPRLLTTTLLRGMLRQGKMVQLRCEIRDEPGVLSRVTGVVGELGGNVVEIYHQRLFFDVPVKMADLDMVIETRNERHVQELLTGLAAAGFPARVLSPFKG